MRKVERTIDPRIYKLFLKLTDQQRYDFIKDLIKIEEERVEHENESRKATTIL